MEQNAKARRGYSRDGRPDCLQLVIALVVTPDGFPLAYEVMNGNTSDRSTLRTFLKTIETTYGKARRGWVMDCGIPSEAILKEMREAEGQTFYLVGTPKASINKHEKKWLDLPWHKVRDSVQVKLYEHEGEVYVLAKSEGRQAKEIAIRRKRLAKLVRKLRAMRKSLPKRDQLLLRIGAAKKEAGRAFSFVSIRLPNKDEEVTRATFSFQVDKTKLKRAQQRDGHYLLRSNLTGEDPAVLWTRYVQLTQIESVFRSLKSELDPADLSSTRASSRCSCPDRVPCLLSAGHTEEPVVDSCSGLNAGGRAGQAGDHPDGRGLDPDGGWPLADHAAPHTAGEGRSGCPRSIANPTAIPTAAAHQSLPSRCTDSSSALIVVKTFWSPERIFNHLPCAKPAKCERPANSSCLGQVSIAHGGARPVHRLE